MPFLQDFELWDDVGLNIPKPPELLQLYRNFGSHQAVVKDAVDVAVLVKEDDLEPLPSSQESIMEPQPIQVRFIYFLFIKSQMLTFFFK